MNASDFLEKFRDQFDETDPESIELSTVYKDLDEWSSLIAFTVIAMVKVEYNKTVTGAVGNFLATMVGSSPSRPVSLSPL